MNKGKRKASEKFFEVDELILPFSKLRFCPEQLQNLNFLFAKTLKSKTDADTGRKLQLARSVAEILAQSLVCAAGQLDPRFAAKYLITLNEQEIESNTTLEYLIRLDALSTPALYATRKAPKHTLVESDPEHPAGFAKFKPSPPTQKFWGEFVNAHGYLRRDKIQSRFVQLLAQIAINDNLISPLEVDESSSNAAPGKILDAFTMHEVLKRPAEEHVYYGQGGNIPRFPDPRDFRLAIVDDPSGVKLRIEFLSPALTSVSIDVRLLLAIGIDAWPSSTDFPSRIPLGHSDCLLYQKAAQTGLYLTSNGVHPNAWKIETPAAEEVLLGHYSESSTVQGVLNSLYVALKKMHIDYHLKIDQMTYRILNRPIVKSALFHALERDYAAPSVLLFNWSPIYLSTQILRILDGLISNLSNQRLQNYFFARSNLLANPGYLCEEDYAVEAHKIKTYMIKLFDESLMSMKSNLQFQNMLASQKAELLLLQKWNELQRSLLPYAKDKRRNRKRIFCFRKGARRMVDSHYSNRQLEYVGLLVRNMALVKEKVMQLNDDTDWLQDIGTLHHSLDNPVEDIIYVVVAIMEQARDLYLRHTYSLNPGKIESRFDSFTAKLVDALRKDKTVRQMSALDDTSFVKLVLKWLYKSLDFNKKYLQLILKPYLDLLYKTSHSHSFYLEAIKDRDRADEIESLGIFARLVNSREITPAQGLVDAINKNWIWAQEMLETLERTHLRIVLVPHNGIVARYMLSLPKDDNKSRQNDEISLNKIEQIYDTKGRSYLSTIARRLNKTEIEDDLLPIHAVLKHKSPMTLIIAKKHRRGEHRCCGDIFQTLLLMQKTNLIHEMAGYLPEEERLELVEAIHKMTTEKSKKAIQKRWSNTLPPTSKTILYPNRKAEGVQRYIPKDDWEDSGNGLLKNFEAQTDSLIGSCRSARIKEDSNVGLLEIEERFKAKTLIRSQQS